MSDRFPRKVVYSSVSEGCRPLILLGSRLRSISIIPGIQADYDIPFWNDRLREMRVTRGLYILLLLSFQFFFACQVTFRLLYRAASEPITPLEDANPCDIPMLTQPTRFQWECVNPGLLASLRRRSTFGPASPTIASASEFVTGRFSRYGVGVLSEERSRLHEAGV